MARSKITKRVKLSRHRRQRRRNSRRSGGSHAHGPEEKFLMRLRNSDLEDYSIASVLNLVSEASKHSNHVDKILRMVEKSSCGEVRTMSELIDVVKKRSQHVRSGKEIDEKKMNEILGNCMEGLDNLDIAVLLSMNDFFGSCSQRGGMKRRWRSTSERDPHAEADRREAELAEEPWMCLQFLVIMYLGIAGISMARDYLGFR